MEELVKSSYTVSGNLGISYCSSTADIEPMNA